MDRDWSFFVFGGADAGQWQLAFAQTYRTREFDAQKDKYNAFGTLTLTRVF